LLALFNASNANEAKKAAPSAKMLSSKSALFEWFVAA
jgi:hypothetical protein